MKRPAQVLLLAPVLPSYEQALVDHDLTCFHCARPDDFLTILQEGDIELILSDFSFPELGASEIQNLLKRENLDVPVLAVLDQVGEEQIGILLNEGIADCIAADQIIHLKAAIHREISNYRKRQELRQQRLDDIRSLSGRLAHDFNNVLAPITMSAPMLKWEIEDAEYDDIVETMEQSAQNGAAMIRDLLLFGRGTKLQRSNVKLETLLEETVSAYRQTLPANLRLHLQVEDGLPVASVDPEKFKQALIQILDNAREAMPDGGSIEVHAGKEYGGENLQISVRDQGEGIDPTALSQIFDPYFSTRRHMKKGAGLGLSLALGIVKSHGGQITVSSRKGKGSRFRIDLPVQSS